LGVGCCPIPIALMPDAEVSKSRDRMHHTHQRHFPMDDAVVTQFG